MHGRTHGRTDGWTDGRTENIYSIFRDKLLLLGEHVQLTGDLLVMAISIQVAHLLAHCVHVGSLAELLFSFRMRSMLVLLQMVDAIIGEVISSMVFALALKVHYLTLSWFCTKNEVM